MKLDPQELDFIDTYLKNSGIEYLDLRMEILDHVATGVLEKMKLEKISFYESFKAYMIIHKNELLKWDKKFRKVTETKVLRKLRAQLLSPLGIAVFFCCLILLKISAGPLNLIEAFSYIPFGVFLVVLFFYFYHYRFVLKNRFSGLERIGLLLSVFSQGMMFLFSPVHTKVFFQEHTTIYLSLISLVVVMGFVFTRIIHDLKKEYAVHYQIA